MAWVDGKWLKRQERDEIASLLREYLDALDESYGSYDAMSAADQAEYYEKAIELDRLERISRCENDLLEFSIEYFGDIRNDGNDGNWDGFDVANTAEAPAFHREITDIMNDVSSVNTNAKIAVAAPRSHAKSTYLSKAFPIHQVVYRLRKYIIIISETPTVSTGNMEWIRNQMKFNRKLREDFGPLLSPKDQANITDKSDAFIAWHPEGDGRKQVALVEAASTGQALRGRNWNGSRPDAIVLDDLEDARPGGNASTPEQRAKLKDWFAQTVIPLGDPKGKRTAFVYMGTTVHWEALLMDVLHKNPEFESRIFRAIIEPPIRTDLWEKCREIYVDRQNEFRKRDAEAFYQAHEKEMLEGSEVLWADAQPLFKLMKWKWTYGSKAFNTEYMNNPIDEESAVFLPSAFYYWTDKREINFDHVKYSSAFDVTMGVDLAMGKQRGDYSAITVIARHKETGVEYVIDSYGEKIKANAFLDVIVKKVIEWQPHVIAAEAQAAQEFFVDQLKEALEDAGYPAGTRVKKIYQRSRKDLRIEALLPDIESGKLRFDRSHHLLLEQFERYGSGSNDDLPDSLEMAKSALSKVAKKIIDKPAWL